MTLSVESFVLPKLDENGKIKARQRFLPGMLARVYHRRYPNGTTTAPKGTYWVQLVRQHEERGYWVVRNLGKVTRYGEVRHDLRTEWVTSTRSLLMVHPDPQHVANQNLPDYPGREVTLTRMYSNYAAGILASVRNALAAKIVGWAPKYPGIRTRLTNEYRQYAAYGQSYASGRKTNYLQAHTRLKERGHQLGLLLAREDWSGAINYIDNAMHLGGIPYLQLADKVKAKARAAGMVQRGCRHWEANREGVITTLNGGDLCHQCEHDALVSGMLVQAIDRNGAEVWVNRNWTSVYVWADGSKRTYQEPPLVGSYHSSKGFFTKPFLNPDGSQYKGLCMGMELEFVRASGYNQTENQVVSRMYADLEAALPRHGKTSIDSRYCAFEHDGSVDFEMVTGFGGLDTHRAAVIAMFGGNQYARELRSHDGGRCGIHVHLDKPKSLIHAIKLTQFWHAAGNAPLIKAVARRYDAGARYAKVVPEKMKSASEQANLISGAKQSYRWESAGARTRRNILNAAISRINRERYELLNYHNERTVEVRAFRGTLRTETIIACLEFAYATWFFCRDTPAHKLTTQEFLRWIGKEENRKDTAYLRRYLDGKGFDVWLPKAPKVPLRPALDMATVADMDVDADPVEPVALAA